MLRVRDDTPSMDMPAGQICDGIVDLIEGIALGHQRVQVELASFIPTDEDGEIAIRATQAAACPSIGTLGATIVTISSSPCRRDAPFASGLVYYFRRVGASNARTIELSHDDAAGPRSRPL